MAEIINLNRARKKAERDQRAENARTNRVRFGRTLQEKRLDRERDEEALRRLEEHRLDPTTPEVPRDES